VSHSPVTANLSQSANIEVYLPSKITLYPVPLVDRITNAGDLFFSQILDFLARVDPHLRHDPLAEGRPNTVDVRQANLNPFLVWNVNTSNTCH